MAVVVPGYVFVAVPKTGSSAVRKWLRDCFDPRRGINARSVGHAHCSLSDVPERIREGRVSFATCRDPLEWYASWYSHALGIESAQYRAWVATYGSNFREVLYAATHPEEGRVPFRPGLFYDVPHSGLKQAFLDSGKSLYQWTMSRLLDGVDHVVDYRRLEAGVSEVMGRPVTLPVMNTKHDRNRNALGDYRGLYDAEMISWIEADRAFWLREVGEA